MPKKSHSPTPEAADVMHNCSYESQCATWLMQDGWQVYTPMLDHGHKTDLLVTDGARYYPIQVKAIEAQDQNTQVENKWKGSSVKFVVYFAKNSNWGYIIPAFTTNRARLDQAGGQKFKQAKNSFIRAFHLLP